MIMSRPTRRPTPAFTLDALEVRRAFNVAPVAAPYGAAPRAIGLDALQASAPTITGAGQTIAIVDTGIDYTNASLGGGFGAGHKVVAGYDFVDNDADPMDTDGHGTAVAGVAAASRFESGGFAYQGVAPDARLVALRIAAEPTNVSLGRIMQALDWVLNNAQAYGITVVNLSFGFGTFDGEHAESTLNDDLGALRERGIAFVASSGNNGLANGPGITYPAADATAFSVGSINTSGGISEFTQRATNLDLLAVGENVVSTKRGGGYDSFFGTSFASPAVAGAIALLRQVDASFALGDVRSMFRASSPANRDGDDEAGQTTGYDFQQLNVDRTVRLALQRKAGTVADQQAIGAHGSFNRLVYDGEGVAHVVYFDDAEQTMRYATRSLDGQWSTPISIDPSVPGAGTEFSLRLDRYGRPRVAYLDSPNGDLKFARFDDAAWTVQTLDSKGVTGLSPSLAIASDDTMYVAYLRKTAFDLRVMSLRPSDGGEWHRETIDTQGSVGWGSTIALDAAGRPAIAYGDVTLARLKLARLLADETWSFETIEQNVKSATYLSLAFDALDHPRLSYYAVDAADLKFAAYDGDEWTAQKVSTRGATGLYTNLRIDDDGSASILYWDKRTNAILEANGAGTGRARWSLSRVISNGGKYLSASESTTDDVWTYAASAAGRLIFATL